MSKPSPAPILPSRSILLGGAALLVGFLSIVQAGPAAAGLEEMSRDAAKVAAARRSAVLKAAETTKPASRTARTAAPAPIAPPTPVAAGSTRGEARFDAARRRYAVASGAVRPETETAGERKALGFARMPEASAVTLDETSVQHLLKRHWRGVGRGASDPRRMIERNRDFMAIARAMGLDVQVGALQAIFGTPQENGLAKRVKSVEEARGRLAGKPGQATLVAVVNKRESELDKATARLPQGPKGGWAFFDLDVNADGRINRADAKAATAEKGGRKSKSPVTASIKE